MRILVTGAAGFIGFHLTNLLLKNKDWKIVGIDSLNDYYSVDLKLDRLKILRQYENFQFHAINITDKPSLDELFRENRFEIVYNLAAQAGVRYSIEQPYKYIDANFIGFINLLEACRVYPVKHLIFASSSSVYGNSQAHSFSEDDVTDAPVSLYAASKKSNEVMAHSYSALYGIPCTGLRFFTVYGPFGRPDMAYYKFSKKIVENETIELFNEGNLQRDFTYIDDIVEGMFRLMDFSPENSVPFDLFNIGNNNPVELLHFVEVLEKELGKRTEKVLSPMQAGDVYKTYANIDKLHKKIGYVPRTSIEEGLQKFVAWFKDYYRI
jgi:UDP-glucuronate 4-epimerase